MAPKNHPAAPDKTPRTDGQLPVPVQHIAHHVNRFLVKILDMPGLFDRQPQHILCEFDDLPNRRF